MAERQQERDVWTVEGEERLAVEPPETDLGYCITCDAMVYLPVGNSCLACDEQAKHQPAKFAGSDVGGWK